MKKNKKFLSFYFRSKIMTSIQSFMKRHFKHFNAAVCVDAAEG